MVRMDGWRPFLLACLHISLSLSVLFLLVGFCGSHQPVAKASSDGRATRRVQRSTNCRQGSSLQARPAPPGKAETCLGPS